MNYKVNFDYSFTYISRTDEEEVGNSFVYEKLSDAKHIVREYIKEEIKNYEACLARTNKLKEDDIEID